MELIACDWIHQGGARYGTGYCDAQCPHDVKWIYGKANSRDWTPSDDDLNSGKGSSRSLSHRVARHFPEFQ